MIAGDEISLDLRRYFAGPVRVFLREPDPFDRRMARATSPRKSPTRPPPTIASPMPFCRTLSHGASSISLIVIL